MIMIVESQIDSKDGTTTDHPPRQTTNAVIVALVIALRDLDFRANRGTVPTPMARARTR